MISFKDKAGNKYELSAEQMSRLFDALVNRDQSEAEAVLSETLKDGEARRIAYEIFLLQGLEPRYEPKGGLDNEVPA